MLGLQGSTENYACPLCTVHKDDRYDMSGSDSKYNSPPYARTLRSLLKGPKEKGRIHPPLIEIDIDHAITDELHLFLRITDVLTRNVVLEMREWDVLEVGSTSADEGKGPHVAALIAAFEDLGITFSVWSSAKKGQDMDFTSLMGPAKRKMLAKLPQKFNTLLRSETSAEVKWLWEEFAILYEFLSSWRPSVLDLDAFQQRAKDWINSFCALGDRRLGYQKVNVTLYTYDFAQHVHHALRTLEEHSLKPYSCTPIEKKNDFARLVTLWHSNNHKAAHDVLLASERQAYLQPYQREPRSYKARKASEPDSDDNSDDNGEDNAEVHRLKPCPPKPVIPAAIPVRNPSATRAQMVARAAAYASICCRQCVISCFYCYE